MNSKITSLDKIRQQFGGPPKETCPLCSHDLTIETTQFFVTKLCENCFEFSQIDEVDGCCSTPDLQHVKYVIEGGGIQIREQCKSCGWCSGKSLGGFTSDKINKLPRLDKELRDQFDTNKYSLRRQFLKRVVDKKYELKKDSWFRQYNEYLKSPQWQEKRSAVLKRDKYTCQCCLDAIATQVHHKSYEFVDMNGNEPAYDLVAICSPCHEKIEQMKQEKRRAG